MNNDERKIKIDNAINILKGLYESLDSYCELNDEGKKAFNLAIEVLERYKVNSLTPCEVRNPDKYIKE